MNNVYGMEQIVSEKTDKVDFLDVNLSIEDGKTVITLFKKP